MTTCSSCSPSPWVTVARSIAERRGRWPAEPVAAARGDTAAVTILSEPVPLATVADERARDWGDPRDVIGDVVQRPRTPIPPHLDG